MGYGYVGFHYYPFGLKMEGISSRAAGGMINKDKTFQGQKFDDDLGVNYYSFKWRNHDPQIGRFIEIDPLAEDYVYNSTYAFSKNKVTNHIELEGLEAVFAGTPMGYLSSAFGSMTEALASIPDRVTSFFTKAETEISSPKSTYTGASTVFSTTATTEYGTNFLGLVQHSKVENATLSNGPSAFKMTTDVKIKIELKQEVNLGIVKVGTKTSLDGSAVEVKGEAKGVVCGVPIFGSLSGTKDYKAGEVKGKAKVGTGTVNNQAFGEVEVTNKNNKTTTKVSIGVEEKTGNVKQSFSIGKIF